MKKRIIAIMTIIMCFLMAGCTSQQDYDEVVSKNDVLSSTIAEMESERDNLNSEISSLESDNESLKSDQDGLKNEIADLESNNDTLKNEISGLEADNESLKNEIAGLESDKESLENELNEVNETLLIPQLKEEAGPVIAAIDEIGEVSLDKEEQINNAQNQYEGLGDGAKEYVSNYDTLVSAQAVISEIKDSQSEEEKAQEYKNSCGAYSYTDIARDPDTYKGNNAVFTGQIIQVQESSGVTVLRVNVTQGKYSWDDTIYVTYYPSSGGSRLLEDDIVTIYGELQGIKTYTTVLGASVSIPAISAMYIDIN